MKNPFIPFSVAMSTPFSMNGVLYLVRQQRDPNPKQNLILIH